MGVFKRALATVAVAAAGFPGAASAAPQRADTRIRAELTTRLRQLSDFECRFAQAYVIVRDRREDAHYKRLEAKMRRGGFNGGFFMPPPGVYRSRGRMWRLNGLLRIDKVLGIATAKTELGFGHGLWTPLRSISVFSPARNETLTVMSMHSRPFGTIAEPSLGLESPLLWAIGVVAPKMRHWLTPSDVAKMALAPLSHGRWSVTRVVSVKLGRTVARIYSIWTVSAGRAPPELLSFTELYDKFAVLRVKCSGFVRTAGLSLPTRLTARSYFPHWGLINEHRLSGIRFQIRPIGDTKSVYRIKFPSGSFVHDVRVDHTFQIGRHPSYLTDHEIFMRLKH